MSRKDSGQLTKPNGFGANILT